PSISPCRGLRVVEVTILCSDSFSISPSQIVVFPLPAGPEMMNSIPLPVALFDILVIQSDITEQCPIYTK
mgnify:CR=1